MIEIIRKLKFKVKVNKILHPKGKISSGDFAIFSGKVMEEIEGGSPISNEIYNTITVKGTVPQIKIGEIYTVYANEINDIKYGIQYEIINIGQPMNLKNKKDQFIFLRNVLTEKQLEEFYKVYKDPFEIIKSKDIQKITKVKGIGKDTAKRIIDKYNLKIDNSSIYVELNNYGLTQNMMDKLLEKYKSPQIVIDKIKRNPYILIEEIDNVGWGKADKLALNNGMSKASINRIKAYFIYKLKDLANKGYSYISPIELLKYMVKDLGKLDNSLLKQSIQKLYSDNLLWHNSENNKTTKVALTRYYNLENQVSNELKRIYDCKNNFNIDGWQSKIKQIEKEQNWEFTEEQLEAIKLSLENQIVMITGGAGVGKTATISAIVKILSTYKIGQCALSGRAASRMSEMSGEEGSTIHRLLEYDPKTYKFTYNKENQLEEDIIIVDEISMLGGNLFYDLIQAIKNGAKLILVGDMHQLEAIGCMNIAKDIMSSKLIKTVELTKIHRQATKSGIITQSKEIRNKKPLFKSTYFGHELRGELKDFEIDINNDRSYNLDKIIMYFKRDYNICKDINEIQILVPTKERGECCTFNINNKIQEIYNPQNGIKEEMEISLSKNKSYILREGDKIMVIQNNYKVEDEDGVVTPIFNGQLGIIDKIDTFEGVLYLNIPMVSDKRIIIKKKELTTIQLAYACTVAKSQGSQFDYIIGCIDYSTPPMMLTKELVYTLVTRAKKHCTLIGQNKALYKAMTTSFVSKKQTFLKDMLDNNKIN